MPGPCFYRLTIAAVALTCAVTSLSGCGDDFVEAPTVTKTASNGDVYNSADVAFATALVPHHAQAIQMVTLLEGRDVSGEVERLANAIRDRQAPEVEIMIDWLTAWDEPIPETSLDHANAGHDSGESGAFVGMDDMPGMLSTEQIEQLSDASGTEFETMWLELMKEHHQGAVSMAEMEVDDGDFEAAVALAQTMITTHRSEIGQIVSLLGDAAR